MTDQIISFDVDLATNIGVNPAVMLKILSSMCDSENSWIYCSISEFGKKIPFFKNYTICESLSTLEAEKYIISKNIKTHPFDRTISYQLTKKAWRVLK